MPKQGLSRYFTYLKNSSDWLVFNSCDWCISILAVLVGCSPSGPHFCSCCVVVLPYIEACVLQKNIASLKDSLKCELCLKYNLVIIDDLENRSKRNNVVIWGLRKDVEKEYDSLTLCRRANARNVSFLTRYGGQFTIST